MRIIAGEFRSRKLNGVPGATGGLRPTSDRVRENVFNILGIKVEDAVFLDLFAGTGAIGLEALSRGARRTVFVDSSTAAQRTIRANIALLDVGGRAEIASRNAMQWLKGVRRTFDIVYIDPPYDSGVQRQVIEILGQGSLLNEEAVILLERKAPLDLDMDHAGVLHLVDSRKYGKTHIDKWEHKPETNV